MAPRLRVCCRNGMPTLSCVVLMLYLLAAAVLMIGFTRYSRMPTKGLASLFSLQRWLKQGNNAAVDSAITASKRGSANEFEGTAIVTLAAGDAAARHTVVLLKSLRDSNTRIPHLVVLLSRGGMGSEDCHNETLRNTRNRHYPCSGPNTQADDIVSQKYLDAFVRLGAEVRIIDAIPDTKYTALIPGGRATFWVRITACGAVACTELRLAAPMSAHLSPNLCHSGRAGHVIQQTAYLQHDGVPQDHVHRRGRASIAQHRSCNARARLHCCFHGGVLQCRVSVEAVHPGNALT